MKSSHRIRVNDPIADLVIISSSQSHSPLLFMFINHFTHFQSCFNPQSHFSRSLQSQFCNFYMFIITVRWHQLVSKPLLSIFVTHNYAQFSNVSVMQETDSIQLQPTGNPTWVLLESDLWVEPMHCNVERKR